MTARKVSYMDFLEVIMYLVGPVCVGILIHRTLKSWREKRNQKKTTRKRRPQKGPLDLFDEKGEVKQEKVLAVNKEVQNLNLWKQWNEDFDRRKKEKPHGSQ